MNKLLERLIKEKNKNQHEIEVYLSKNYNQFLLYSDIIEKMEIAQHYRILQMAIENEKYNNLPYDILASFLINQLEKGHKDISILMTLVDVKKFIREDLSKIVKLTNFDDSPFKLSNDYIFQCLNNDKKEISMLINSSFNTINQQLKDINSNLLDIQNKQDLLKSEISSVKKNIKTETSDIKKNLETKISDIKENLKSEISDIKENLKSDISDIKENLKTDISDIKENLKTEISGIKENLKSEISGFKKNIKTQISGINENIKIQVSGINENINIETSNIISKQKELNAEIKNCIQNLISKSQDKNNEFLTSKINELKKKINDTQAKSNELILSKAEENKKSIDLQINDVKSKIPLSFHYSSDYKIDNVLNFLMFKENLPLYVNYNDSYHGLFHFFNLKIGNPFDNNLFEIKGNSEIGFGQKLNKIVNTGYDIYESWKSKDENDSYIQIDFKKYSFRFKAITFETGQYGMNKIGSFSIEGLNSGNTWNCIRCYQNEECSYKFIIGKMDNYAKDSYRYIRIRMDGLNSSDNNCLCIKNLELYGILNERIKK